MLVKKTEIVDGSDRDYKFEGSEEKRGFRGIETSGLEL